MIAPKTIVDRIWDAHLVAASGGTEDLLFVDRIFLHERTGPALLAGLDAKGRQPAHPRMVFGAMDHIVDTSVDRTEHTTLGGGQRFIRSFRQKTAAAGIRIFDLPDARQGISHVVSAE